MSDEAVNNLAAQIAQLLQSQKPEIDLLSLQKSIEKVGERLDKIETVLQSQNIPANTASFSNFAFKHPSQEKFDVGEMDYDQTKDFAVDEKLCPYEPTGKTCDHCSMCNSRGF